MTSLLTAARAMRELLRDTYPGQIADDLGGIFLEAYRERGRNGLRLVILQEADSAIAEAERGE